MPFLKAILRRRSSIPIALVVGILLGVGGGVAYAAFFKSTLNSGNLVTAATLVAPSGLTATASGHNVNLAWTAAPGFTTYDVAGVANGTSSNCTSATYASLGSATGTSYADSGRYQPQGTYMCYRVATKAGSWVSTSGNPTAAVRIGVFVTSVSVANGANTAGCSASGVANRLDCGDRVVLNFNQPIDPASGPASTATVCGNATAAGIYLGSTTQNGGCAAGETLHVGRIPATLTGNGRFTATYTWSNSNQTLTIDVRGQVAGSTGPPVSSATAFNPTTNATSLRSTTGSQHVCDTNTGGGDCLRTVTGSF